jgi:dihydrofolate reductase
VTATYTWDIFSSVDGWGSHDGHWGAYWSKQGPELIARRREIYGSPQRILFGATTFRAFLHWMTMTPTEPADGDTWTRQMREMPAWVISSTLTDTSDWPDATIVSGDAVAIVQELKETSDVPLRSHGSLSLNRALLAGGVVDRLHITVFPVITGRTGEESIFRGAADFDLQLLESRRLDEHIEELVYAPTVHAGPAD